MTQKQGFTSPFDRHVLSILSSFDKLRMTGYAEGIRVTKKQLINRYYLMSVHKVRFFVIPHLMRDPEPIENTGFLLSQE